MSYSNLKARSVKFIDFTEEIKRSIEKRKYPKISRVKLESWQLERLEQSFAQDTHPSYKSKAVLSEALFLPPKSVQIWFQNKRAKEKVRKEREEFEDMEKASQIPVQQEATIEEPVPSKQSFVSGSQAPLPPTDAAEKGKRGRRNEPVQKYTSKLLADLPGERECTEISYEDCYNEISNITNFDDSDFLSLDHTSSLFDLSPITCSPRKRSAPDFQQDPKILSLFPEREAISRGSEEQRTASGPPASYRVQLRNGSIIYSTPEEKAEFLQQVLQDNGTFSCP